MWHVVLDCKELEWHGVAAVAAIIQSPSQFCVLRTSAHACGAQVLDDKNVRRRFRASNYQSNTRVKPFICTMPMRLDDGWNQIQFNLGDFTRRAYGTNYIETLRVQVSDYSFVVFLFCLSILIA